MNSRDYLQYLKSLVGDDSDRDWASENTAGLFQHFRPDGKGVEKVFAPVADVQCYLQRILPVYRATAGQECAGDMYFVVRSPVPSELHALEVHAMAFVRNLRALAGIIGDRELLEVTGNLSRVSHQALSKDAFGTHEYLTVYEVVGDWLIAQTDHADLIPVLSEAFYSVACDYWLADYLRWPYYEQLCAVDIFAPYFELWRRGVACSFRSGTIVVGRRTDAGEQTSSHAG